MQPVTRLHFTGCVKSFRSVRAIFGVHGEKKEKHVRGFWRMGVGAI